MPVLDSAFAFIVSISLIAGVLVVARALAGKKLGLWQYISLAGLTIVAILASWLSAQILVSAAVLVGTLILLLGYRWIIKLNWKRAAIGAGIWIILWYAANLLVALTITTIGRAS